MKTTYPITPAQQQLLQSAKLELQGAQELLGAHIAMAFAGAGIQAGNLVDVRAGQMIVETPDPEG